MMTFCRSVSPSSLTFKMQMFPRGQELKRIPASNVEKACRNYMGARRGGETDPQNVIMHKAYKLSSRPETNFLHLEHSSSCHVFTLAIAKVGCNGICCLVLKFTVVFWIDFRKEVVPLYGSRPSPTDLF